LQNNTVTETFSKEKAKKMNAKTNSSAPETSPPVIHPAVAPLSYLLGTWRGQGEGGFPTINSFSYGEELHFSHSPNKVFLSLSP